MTEVTVVTLNAMDLYRHDTTSERGRHALVAEVLSADYNTLSAATTAGRFYDPDPYEHVSPDRPPRTDTQRHDVAVPADRVPDQILAAGGLLDAAVALQAPWVPTTGHWPGERNGYRRLDRHLVTANVADALTGGLVDNTPPARAASNHLPAVVTIDLAALGQPPTTTPRPMTLQAP
jgi:hypothetical protein